MLTVSGIKLIASEVDLYYFKIERELENDMSRSHKNYVGEYLVGKS